MQTERPKPRLRHHPGEACRSRAKWKIDKYKDIIVKKYRETDKEVEVVRDSRSVGVTRTEIALPNARRSEERKRSVL